MEDLYPIAVSFAFFVPNCGFSLILFLEGKTRKYVNIPPSTCKPLFLSFLNTRRPKLVLHHKNFGQWPPHSSRFFYLLGVEVSSNSFLEQSNFKIKKRKSNFKIFKISKKNVQHLTILHLNLEYATVTLFGKVLASPFSISYCINPTGISRFKVSKLSKLSFLP